MYNNAIDYQQNANFQMNSQNGDRIFGGFLGPFILGGITGGLVAPYFNNYNQGYYQQPYYTNNYYYPPYYYGPYYY